jgi:UTP-glucose-1-phosphate uridylyltransferase
VRFFVPGRICLFGEHSDWAGGYRRVNPALEKGYTLICGTEQGIYAAVEPHPDALVLAATTSDGERLGPYQIPLEPEALLAEARQGGFWSYAAGVAYQVIVHHRVRGLVVDNDRTDLPIKKGLSSSAAICVLIARAFNRLYDLKLTVRGEMELAYQGEITTPSRCGRMDQGCAFGNSSVLMAFDGDRLDTAQVPIGGDVHLVVVDLQAAKNTRRILRRLNACYPEAHEEVARGVQTLLGPTNRVIVHRAAEALGRGDARALGALMTEAQALFDRYAAPACPQELTAPVLHRVLAYEPLQPHVWGGKGVGSQGDGSAQFVARSRADQLAAIDLIQAELAMPCLALTLRANRSAPTRGRDNPVQIVADAPPPAQDVGLHRIRRAVVPAAGLGTRLFPASRAVKKELFPIVDRDGLAKPALLLIVEEVLAAGIEEVIVVVQEGGLAAFRAFFHAPLPPADRERLTPELQSYAARIVEAGRRVSFVVQRRQEGFGHAVYLARQAVGGEPFLLLLGDHIYRSGDGRSCAQQMLDVYRRHGQSILGLRRVPEAEVVHYGLAAGDWLDRPSLLTVRRLAEKPAVAQARAHLRVRGLADDEFLAFFGQYALTPAIFDYLEKEIARQRRQRGEYQLTPALAHLQAEEGMLGLVVAGESFDIGLPQAYRNTVGTF